MWCKGKESPLKCQLQRQSAFLWWAGFCLQLGTIFCISTCIWGTFTTLEEKKKKKRKKSNSFLSKCHFNKGWVVFCFIQKSRCLSSCSAPFQRHTEVVWVLVLDECCFQWRISTCSELYAPGLAEKRSPGFQVNAFLINPRGRVAFSVFSGLPWQHHHINHSYHQFCSPFLFACE